MTEVAGEREVARAVSDLVRVLDVEEIDDNLYRGAAAPNERGRAFGGAVAAQSVMAAIRTADPAMSLHSMHSYFLLPGDPSAPIVYEDFLPASAAGIFRSNLDRDPQAADDSSAVDDSGYDLQWLAGAIDREIHDPYPLYAKEAQ